MNNRQLSEAPLLQGRSRAGLRARHHAGSARQAEAALAAFTERLPGREIAYTEHEIQIDSPTTHRQVADAATRIHVGGCFYTAAQMTSRQPPRAAR